MCVAGFVLLEWYGCGLYQYRCGNVSGIVVRDVVVGGLGMDGGNGNYIRGMCK